MNSKKLLLALVLVPFVFSSCQKIKDALTVKQDVSFTISMPVTVGGTELKTGGLTYPFSASMVFDPMTDETVQQYADQIKGFALTELTLKVDQISDAPVTLSDTELNITATIDGTEITVTLTANQLWNNGDTKTIGNEDWATIEQMLDALVPITCTLTGNCDKPAVTFTLSAVLNSEVSVRIL
jgi:hypothetical protein